MLEKIFASSGIIAEHRCGPMGRYSDIFAQWLMAVGYSRRDLRRRFGVVSDLNRWLKDHRLRLLDLTPQRVEVFFRHRTRKVKSFYGSGNHATVEQLLTVLRAHGAIPAAARKARQPYAAIDKVLGRFVQYLEEEKGFSETAKKRYFLCARQFLVWRFGRRSIVLETLSAADITGFIAYYRNRYSVKNVQVTASVLRAYLRFLFSMGTLPSDLSGAITSIPCWRGRRLPVFLESHEVAKLLHRANRPTKVGKRNYAMLLLMLRLGLRASEVLNITLDDIQWERGTLWIDGKGHKRAVLPLPHDVGSAMARYLRYARPDCSSRKLFLRSRAPYDQLHSPSSIGTVVKRALIAAKLYPAHMGSHLLRYTAATQSLRRGASLPEVRDLLRHRSIDTTAVYAKIDLARLSELVQHWPAI